MENIRAYCEYIDLYFQVEPNQEKQHNYDIEQNRCLDAISNRLLSMDDINKKYYAKMIANYFEKEASICFDLFNAFLPDDDKITKEDVKKELEEAGELATEEEISLIWIRAKQRRSISDDATLSVAELVWKIERYFSFCGISLNDYFRFYVIPNEVPIITKCEDVEMKPYRKLGAPSVKERVILIKTLVNYVYPEFSRLDDAAQQRFINQMTGIDQNARNISNGSIKNAFDELKNIENGGEVSSKKVDVYNKYIDNVSNILADIGIEKLANEIKKKKIELKNEN